MDLDARGLLARMVAVDSVNRAISGRERAESELGDVVETLARALGLATRRLPVGGEADDLLVSLPVVDRGAPWLLFECHLDTVGVEGMTVPPFVATESPGRIHGRGACDAKGSGAAMLAALAHAARETAGGSAGVNGAILFSVDEEIGRAGIHRFMDTHLPALGWRPAAVVVGEPTDLRLVVAHSGMVRGVIRTRGIAAHSSAPSMGRSAISAMLPIIRELEEVVFPGLTASHPLIGPAVGSVNVIRGGEQVNIIPATCEIHVDRRTAPGEDWRAVEAGMLALLDRARAADPTLEVEWADPIVHGPLDPATNGRWAEVVGATLVRLGLDPVGIGVAYGTDASEFGDAGIPAVVLGPGSIAQAHAADEWVALDQLDRAVEVYRELLRGPLPG